MKSVQPSSSYTAFAGQKLLASGGLEEVALAAKALVDAGSEQSILVFNDANSQQFELDLRGSIEDVRLRYQASATAEPSSSGSHPNSRGRPKLGVVPREITLLPRHWDWLAMQPGGASATIRRLIDKARKESDGDDRIRQAQDSTYKFMLVMAGNLPHYEEALRALYAKQKDRFLEFISPWPEDIRAHILRLSKHVFDTSA